MKNLISVILLCASGLNSFAGTFACEWNFADFVNEAQTTNRVYITPIARYGVDGTNIITGDRRAYTNSTSSLIVSNLVNGRSYRVEFKGRYVDTIITNTFDTNVTGFVNAASYIAAPVADAGLVAYSRNSADARFHNVSGDSSTNANFYGALKFHGASTSGYVWTATNAHGNGAWRESAGTNSGSSGGANIYFTDGDPLTFVSAQRPAMAYDVTGNFWVKTNSTADSDGWAQRLGSPVATATTYETGTEQINFITGDPNGVTTATRPAVAYDAGGAFWLKTGAGATATGWEQRL